MNFHNSVTCDPSLHSRENLVKIHRLSEGKKDVIMMFFQGVRIGPEGAQLSSGKWEH